MSATARSSITTAGTWLRLPSDTQSHGGALLAALDLGEPPHRHPAPTVLGGEEVPVGHRLAHHRVGDVVGGQPEAVDRQQRQARIQLGRLRLGNAAHAQIAALSRSPSRIPNSASPMPSAISDRGTAAWPISSSVRSIMSDH